MKYTEEEIKTAKKILDIINAILNNKTIQCNISYTRNEWIDIVGMPIFSEKNIDNFRSYVNENKEKLEQEQSIHAHSK